MAKAATEATPAVKATTQRAYTLRLRGHQDSDDASRHEYTETRKTVRLHHVRLALVWLVACHMAGEIHPTLCATAEEDGKGKALPSATAVFPDEPAAHGLYDRMMQTLRKAETLSYTSQYERTNAEGHTQCTYRIWLKKPNYFRMEAISVTGEQGGILIGDGARLWLYWPNGRPQWPRVPETKADTATRHRSFMTKPAPLAGHSIWHEAPCLGVGMGLPIIEPSSFHGFVDVFQDQLDGVRALPPEIVSGEECEPIEVSLLGHQRSWFFWLSKRDHLPRKLRQIVRVKKDSVSQERWSKIAINEAIPDHLFAWKPPVGWTEWTDRKADVPQIGSPAKDFELAALDGGRVRLSDYRGKTVWLCFWRVGCQPCREEIPQLDKLHSKYRDKGLVVLAVNTEDNRDILLQFLREHGVSYPNIFDLSEAGQQVSREYGVLSVPVNCIIDGNGLVVDAWPGYSGSNDRGTRALEKAGGALGKAIRQEWEAAAQAAAEPVTAAAQRLVEALRTADYARFERGENWKAFPIKSEIDYHVERDFRGWVQWVCRKFQAHPISKVSLGEVIAGHDGLPSLHLQLQLQNGEILRGDLSFRWNPKSQRWVGERGFDWHLPKRP